MAKVNIRWNTEEQETKRVLGYLNEMEFYKRNNYQLSLPKDIQPNVAGDEIRKIVALEYAPERLSSKVDAVIDSWKKIEKDFFQNAETILQIKPLPLYQCFITQYGTGGSYEPPNGVILNIHSNLFGFYAIAHEIIHLLIHDLIEEYAIDHWQKERLVDHYFLQILNIERYQRIPDFVDVQQVDEVFGAYSLQGADRLIKALHVRSARSDDS